MGGNRLLHRSGTERNVRTQAPTRTARFGASPVLLFSSNCGGLLHLGQHSLFVSRMISHNRLGGFSMNRFLSHFLGIALGMTVLAAHAAPRLELLAPPRAWQLAEFRVHDAPKARNNFDPETIRLDATITAPAGQTITVPAFWHQEFSRALDGGVEKLTPSGDAHWRIRFTPTVTGPHTLTLAVWQSGRTSTSSPVVTRFDVAASPSAPTGWVTIAKDGRTFATSEGRSLLFAGHNVCWPGARGTHDYDQWFAEMAAAKQNFARLWLAPWWAALEHGPGTLNQYRLDAAWQLDHIFRLAEQHGIYLLLCLDHHGMYQSTDAGWGGSNNFWPTNPYSAAQGGPCAVAADFFRNPTAMKIYQKRLRYLIARYSHSPRLVAWQFFNEIDNIFDRAPVDEATVVNWHVQMARWLKEHDPYRHLIGTSLTGGVDRPAFWNLPEMEFSSYHAYYEPAPARRMAALVADFTARYGKPALIGEFGVDAATWSPSWDPHLRGFRQNLWAGALGGSAATGLSWWWEDVHGDNALGQQAVLTHFLRENGWFDGGWTPLTIDQTLDHPAELGDPLVDEAPFNAHLVLNNFRRLRLDGRFAVANRLAAERASEHLSSVLWGSQLPEAQTPLRITVHAAANARLVVNVKETLGAATLVARIDNMETWRVPYAAASTAAQTLTAPLSPGRHVIEIANEGAERIHLTSVRIDGVQPARFANGWNYRPEAFGLRRRDAAMLYVVAPAAVFPAGAIRYELPPVANETVTLLDWPEGAFTVIWYDPETGDERARHTARANGGRLVLPLPLFSVDLAGRIERTP
jgi:hypothetical protein